MSWKMHEITKQMIDMGEYEIVFCQLKDTSYGRNLKAPVYMIGAVMFMGYNWRYYYNGDTYYTDCVVPEAANIAWYNFKHSKPDYKTAVNWLKQINNKYRLSDAQVNKICNDIENQENLETMLKG